MGRVPGQRAASAQPLVLYVAPENVLGSLEEHRERHTRDVALLRGGHLVAEGKLQQRLKAHLRKVLPHPHIDLCLCEEESPLHVRHSALKSDSQMSGQTGIDLLNA